MYSRVSMRASRVSRSSSGSSQRGWAVMGEVAVNADSLSLLVELPFKRLKSSDSTSIGTPVPGG